MHGMYPSKVQLDQVLNQLRLRRDPGFEPTNCQFGCSAQTTITDLRSLPSTVNFAEYGFTVIPHKTCMRSDIAKLDES